MVSHIHYYINFIAGTLDGATKSLGATTAVLVIAVVVLLVLLALVTVLLIRSAQTNNPM